MNIVVEVCTTPPVTTDDATGGGASTILASPVAMRSQSLSACVRSRVR